MSFLLSASNPLCWRLYQECLETKDFRLGILLHKLERLNQSTSRQLKGLKGACLPQVHHCSQPDEGDCCHQYQLHIKSRQPSLVVALLWEKNPFT